MEARAITRFVHMAPRKARLVVDLIRGRAVGDALTVLDYTPKKAARILAKTLNGSVMTLIVGTAIGSLLLGYRGLFRLVCNDPETGMIWLFAGIAMGFGCMLLCRHRHELADS